MDEKDLEKDTKSESCLSVSSNDLFTTIYDINRAIFRHLPIRTVDSCSSVCQSWADMARFIKENRHTIHKFSYPLDISLSENDTAYDLSNFDETMSSFIKNNLWSVPSLALVVATSSLHKKGFTFSSNSSPSPSPSKYPRRSQSQTSIRHTKTLEIPQALMRHLNKSCKVLEIISSGVIVTDHENQSYEIEEGTAMGMLLFPKFPPNVLGIYPFEIKPSEKIPNNMSRSDLHRLFGGVPDDIPIRCIIIFFTERQVYIYKLITKIFEHYYPNVAIVGGFSEKNRFNDRKNQQRLPLYNTSGLVLTGDREHLNVKQVLLKSLKDTRETIREKLKQLQSTEYHNCLSFGIQVSCVGRGAGIYNNEKNVECSEFKNLFPKTPLIGIFGNGEVGNEYLSNDNQPSQNDASSIDEKVMNACHSYSTVFSLISLRM